MLDQLLGIPVLVVSLDGAIDELCGALPARPAITTSRTGPDAGEVVGGFVGIEDAVDGVAVCLQDAGGGEVGEVLAAGFEDVFAWEDSFEEEVAVGVEAGAELVEGEVRVGGAKEGGVFGGEGAVADGEGLGEDAGHFVCK